MHEYLHVLVFPQNPTAPLNVAVCFCQLIPLKAALEPWCMIKGWQLQCVLYWEHVHVCTCILYMHTNIGLILKLYKGLAGILYWEHVHICCAVPRIWTLKGCTLVLLMIGVYFYIIFHKNVIVVGCLVVFDGMKAVSIPVQRVLRLLWKVLFPSQ